MHDALHAQKMGFASTFSLPILEDEINHFDAYRSSVERGYEESIVLCLSSFVLGAESKSLCSTE